MNEEKLKYEDFLSTIDNGVNVISHYSKTLSVESIKNYLQYVSIEMYGHVIPVRFVKENNSEIDTFYCAEYNKTWTYAFVQYVRKNNLEGDKDIKSTFHSCMYLSLVLPSIRGINVVNGVIYVLTNDTDLPKYKVLKQRFV